MKKTIITTLSFLLILCLNISAQPTPPRPPRPMPPGEKYGNTLNLGLGVAGFTGRFGYVGHSVPVIHINYELNVAKNFTLAPFISFYTFHESYYWGNNNHPYQYYEFRQTVIPIGVKGTYYFDQLLRANSKWDFYLAGSLGFNLVNTSWSDNYEGDKYYYGNAEPLFLDIHIGAEYHFNNRIGAFLDLSTSVSTIGIAIH
jgi:hypothetical protein